MYYINYLTPNCHRDCNGHIVICESIRAAILESLKYMKNGEYVSCDILDESGRNYGPFCDLRDLDYMTDKYM